MIVGAEWTTAAITWGVLAIVALVAYVLLLALLAAYTRPRVPAPGPPVMDVPGDEPPAVAAFLVNAWKVPRAAVPATLIDLAAWRLLSIEEVGPDDFNVRLRNAQPPVLTDYERRVYDHVRQLADAARRRSLPGVDDRSLRPIAARGGTAFARRYAPTLAGAVSRETAGAAGKALCSHSPPRSRRPWGSCRSRWRSTKRRATARRATAVGCTCRSSSGSY